MKPIAAVVLAAALGGHLEVSGPPTLFVISGRNVSLATIRKLTDAQPGIDTPPSPAG
jgi:hypothetical protein